MLEIRIVFLVMVKAKVILLVFPFFPVLFKAAIFARIVFDVLIDTFKMFWLKRRKKDIAGANHNSLGLPNILEWILINFFTSKM